MDKTVYFVRHAESAAKAEGVFQAPGTPLSEMGRRQAACVAQRVSKLPLEVLVSSTYERARETAGAISQATGLEPEYSALFVERIKPTVVHGEPVRDPAARAVWDQWNASFYLPGARTDGAENFESLIARVDAALAFLENRSETVIALVTHGHFLRALTARAVLAGNLSVETFKSFQSFATVENTALTIMRGGAAPAERAWRVLVYNDYSHLAGCG
jgi:broad specificity phosphatase PhoE